MIGAHVAAAAREDVLPRETPVLRPLRLLCLARLGIGQSLTDELVKGAFELRVHEEQIGPELVEIELCKRAAPMARRGGC